MLPPAHRLRRSSDFQKAVRGGARAGSETVVVHMLPVSDEAGSIGVPKVGFVVSKAVGNAVHRNQVKRRLRAAAAELLHEIPGASCVVVRALPAAASTDYTGLAEDLQQCVRRATARGRRP